MTKRIYTIPPAAAFIDCLAQGLWHQAGKDPLKLADMLVLLPTRRACRYLREAFPRVIGAPAALLPRMRPIGDLDETEFYFADGQDLNPDIPPAIPPLRRQMLLARMVRDERKIPLDQAAQLAASLGEFLDQVQIERRDFKDLGKLVPEDLAAHWQETIDFLSILTKAWPETLAGEGALDPADRRNRVIEAQTKAWRDRPPSYPVIAAGSTGSIPATADLLDAVTSLPAGAVVLAGLDRELDEEAWQEIDETHPQFGMKKLLEKTGVRYRDVQLWPACEEKPSPRARLLQEAMRPAKVTEAWRDLNAEKIPRDALKGLSRLTLDNARDEAQAVALLMRAALEKPEKTATLVTADRALAGRVAEELARWGIEANDSAGKSLAALPVGGFLLAVLAAANPEAAPVDYLSLLKHPIAASGLDPALCRAKAREAEILIWRASRPEGERAKEIRDWLYQWKKQFQPFIRDWNKPLPLTERLRSHRELAEQLAASGREKGAARLWSGEDGGAAAEWLDEWQNAASGFPPLSGGDYAGLFTDLLRAVIVRPSYSRHPRLNILGPLEARLAHADLMILGGLNEGSWPPEAVPDPWMSRPMKSQFGLPLPERRIGLSAHDFVQLASAPEAVLTRARRAGNAPTVPSRFLLQLETVLRALGYHDNRSDALAPQEPWAEWGRMLDEPPGPPKPCDPPQPRPPAAARPKTLRVTEIGTWRRNPYAIYARRILDLEKLEPLETDATSADKGLAIHEALEIFLREHPKQLPPHPLDELLGMGRKSFKPYEDQPQVMAFWWPRFVRIAEWFVAEEQERRGSGIRTLKAEAEGSVTLKNGFTLKGRADRIDKFPDGALAIIDYKTGGVPTQADVKAGFEPQLSLLALIAAEGGFADVPAAAVTELSYWKLSGGAEPGKEQPVKEPVDALVETARAGLENLVARFADPQTPYEAVPKPHLLPRYDDYAHLARLLEWGRMTEDT